MISADSLGGTPGVGKSTTAHPHAALMMQYAQDAMETDKPWERWEQRFFSTDPGWEWKSVRLPLYFHEDCQYRRKPKVCEHCGQEMPKEERRTDGAHWPYEKGPRGNVWAPKCRETFLASQKNSDPMEWHDGHPPYAGWWNCESDNLWRWWTGAYWGFSLPSDANPHTIEIFALTYSPNQNVKWRHYYPANAQVPRIDPR